VFYNYPQAGPVIPYVVFYGYLGVEITAKRFFDFRLHKLADRYAVWEWAGFDAKIIGVFIEVPE
jgi:hypothetical protein